MVCSALSILTISSVFAAEKLILPNSTLIELDLNDQDKIPCNGQAEFTIIQINSNSTKNETNDFGVKKSSVIVSLIDGVVGQGDLKIFNKINLENPFQIPYDVRCLNGYDSTTGENRTLSIKKESQESNFFYNVKIDDYDFGIITSNSYYFGSKIPTEKNSTFLIVTGADACNSYGAYRMVNVNLKESDENEMIFEVDISSLFFGRNRTVDDNGNMRFDYFVNGDGKISQTFKKNLADLPLDIKLDNNIRCTDEESVVTDEKFELTINENGIGNLNLPPIRSQN